MNQLLATIPVGAQPRRVAITPDGRHAYVTLEEVDADGILGGVVVIDTQTNTVSATITLGRPSGVVIAPDGQRAYVPNFDGSHGRGVVSVIATDTNTVIESITVSGPGAARRAWRSRPTAATSTWPPTTSLPCPRVTAR